MKDSVGLGKVKKMKIGLDVGSTTLKCVVLDEKENIVYQEYERHFSRITEKASGMLYRIAEQFPQTPRMQIAVSGSAGMGLAVCTRGLRDPSSSEPAVTGYGRGH